jgi:hypothetical protein
MDESAVSQLASQTAAIIASATEEVYSLLTLVKSDLSDIHSGMDSQFAYLSGMVFDIDSHLNAGVSLTTAGARTAADEFLDRNLAGGGSGGARTVRTAFRPLRNRVATNWVTSVMRIYQENDATVSWSAAMTTAAGNPVVEVDPDT